MSKDRSRPKKGSSQAAGKTSQRLKPWRGRLLWVAGVGILVAGAIVYTVPVLERLEEQRIEIAESTAELDELVSENAELQDRLDSLNTPIEIERLARERLGYVREGEISFVVVPAPPVEVPPSPTPTEAPEEGFEAPTIEQDPWYEEWWSYISGSDLAADS